MTTGPHPIAHFRDALKAHRVVPCAELDRLPAGRTVRIGGSVIVRQRPGTAKGLLFLTVEDETGMAQAVISPDLLRDHREVITGNPALAIEGQLQKRDGSISIKAERFWPLVELARAATPSHDFR
jgi:error-prone DNA polymerase